MASNRIEGIRTSDRRLQQIMSEKSDLRSRDEEEIAGYRDAVASETTDPLLISLIFVFDFTCIHPFNDGNGRMSRLLTLLLLYKAGCMAGKYVSIEKEIERTKNAYYNALAASSQGWHEGRNDPGPFVRYMLGTILATYREFEERVCAVVDARLTKAERVETKLRSSVGKVTKRDIAAACPDISQTTIERALSDLLTGGKIQKVGAGPATGYVWKG